ncbi:MAG: DUF115 domain-containing protein [Candidatus Thermoplasmatota archaeon]|nr:DUF115 domain-containing protein [Candidatus Thermoplasmatota archaeon]
MAWKPVYESILRDFGFSERDDESTAIVLDSLLQQKHSVYSLDSVCALLKHKRVIVCGAGPSLESSLIAHRTLLGEAVCITADGATSALLKQGVTPDIIVTDLDGNVCDQVHANAKGSLVIIHAHGDNRSSLEQYVPQFTGPLAGTTQTNPGPYDTLHNFGGFTDGDRAVFLADHCNAQKISLMGFDFTGAIGTYSFSSKKDAKQKLQKLQWCERLINSLQNPTIHYL